MLWKHENLHSVLLVLFGSDVNLFVILDRIWDMTVKEPSVRKDEENGDLVITIEFKPEEFSDQYKVSFCSPDLQPEPFHIVLKVLLMFSI